MKEMKSAQKDYDLAMNGIPKPSKTPKHVKKQQKKAAKTMKLKKSLQQQARGMALKSHVASAKTKHSASKRKNTASKMKKNKAALTTVILLRHKEKPSNAIFLLQTAKNAKNQ